MGDSVERRRQIQKRQQCILSVIHVSKDVVRDFQERGFAAVVFFYMPTGRVRLVGVLNSMM